MLVREIISEAKAKKSKKRRRSAVYGPGAYGLYGTDSSYSGDAGVGESTVAEAIAVPMLLSLIADITGFRAWVNGKIQQAVNGLLTAEEQNTYKQVDQAVAETLGEKDASMGSIVSMLVWNVVLGGTPLNAAILTVRDLVGKELEQGIKTAAVNYMINRRRGDQIEQTLSQNEPWADRAEDAILSAQIRDSAAS